MELVSTIEISGEEREIADAYAREQIDGVNSNLDQLEYSDVAGGKNLAKNIEYTTQSGTYKYLAVGNVYLEKGKTYTMSFTATSDGIGRIYIPNSVGLTNDSPVFVINSTTIRCKKTTIAVNGNDGKNKVDLLTTASDNEGTVTITDLQFEEGDTATDYEPYIPSVKMLSADVSELKNDLSKQCKKDDITTNETLIGTFNGKNYYRKLFTGIGASGSSITVNVGEKIEIYNYYGRAYTYGQSGASDVKYQIPNKNYYIDSQNASETSFQLTIPTSSDTRKVDLVIEYTKVDE